ncbi:PREDICTED: apyrase isoform X3 [Bactrocera latifrons]|uniref:apyrase n=1 Tax=Bactrocera latifrons TaxID=174628 RepID=A0A0K8W0E9_BACLA|nr:PREDICTED: apyrase isoform X3 [Bactrocera latifrons]
MKLLTIITLFVPLISADIFPLSIIHINDFHARFESTDTSGGTCDAGEECIGGLARTIYTVKRLLEEQKDQNPVYFNAGDSFQGTLWYNIGRWNVTSQFLNMLPADAMTLGNHEFDHGIEGVVPFLESINSPMLVANMDARDEPDMQGKYQKSIIIERSNRKIGVIGVILETTYDLANTGNLIFQNESTAIREEAQKLREQGANIIIAITHCGYDVDKLIAQHAADDVDVIVGSHSHTFLYTGDKLPGPDKPYGPYPTEVVHENGHRILIVQAAAYAKYVGNITVYFDDDGNVVDYSGAPIYMGSSVPEDKEVLKLKQIWATNITTEGNVVVGTSRVTLPNYNCAQTECNIGNLYTDAILHAFLRLDPYNTNKWANASIAITTSAEMRASIPRGNITYKEAFQLCSYEGDLIAFDLAGKYLLEALEYSVSSIDIENTVNETHKFLHSSGIRVTYDLRAAKENRVVSAEVRCTDCAIPVYEPLSPNKTYRIIAARYVATGGYGYSMFTNYGSSRNILPVNELTALIDYFKVEKPITIGLQGRIKLI